MKLLRLTNKDTEKYMKFYRGIYRSYPKKKDDMGDFLGRILKGKSPELEDGKKEKFQ